MSRDSVGKDEAKRMTDFPLLKPSIDVFGIPNRSRKQRGRYQVRSRSHATVSPSHRCPKSPCSVADLPPELISTIVAALPIGEHSLLVSCASVCRRWADTLQPKLFLEVMLRSPEQVLQLHAFYDAPLSKVSTYTKYIEVEQKLSSAPFVHLVRVRPQDQLAIVNVILRGPLPSSSAATLRSIHYRIPRSLPQVFFVGIDNLVLGDIHFQSFMHLVRLVRELPDLSIFEGDGLTWPKVRVSPVMPTWRRWSPCQLFKLRRCTPGQKWLALWLGNGLFPTCEHGALVRRVDEMLQDVDGLELSCKPTYIDWTDTSDHSAYLILRFNQESEHQETEVVKDIVLEIHHSPSLWISMTDWAVFAQTCASFQHLQRFTVKMMTGSEQCTAYMHHAHQDLKSLLGARGVDLILLYL